MHHEETKVFLQIFSIFENVKKLVVGYTRLSFRQSVKIPDHQHIFYLILPSMGSFVRAEFCARSKALFYKVHIRFKFSIVNFVI